MTWMGSRWVRGMMVSVVLACGTTLAQAQSLDTRINALLGSNQLKNATVGINIVKISSKGVEQIYGHNATTPLTPASCTKLLTTAAAFSKYGVNANLPTKLFLIGDNLLILGTGDPCFADTKLLDANGQVTDVYDQWAAKLKAAGITSFNDLIVDDFVFDQNFIHPDWKANQLLSWYEAPVGGLNFNANCLDWVAKRSGSQISLELIPPTSYVTAVNKAKVGSSNKIWMFRPAGSNNFELRGTLAASLNSPESVTIVDPGLWSGTILKDRLLAAGIQCKGQVRRRTQTDSVDKPQLVGLSETPILKIIARANRNSLNMAAEALCKRLGHDATKQPGSWENGTAAVEAFAVGQGVAANQIEVHDGSGLSSENRVSALAFTTVLGSVANSKDGKQFIETLAVPGEDGTLERRFKEKAMTNVAAGIHAKTGHIDKVSCLTGYLEVDGQLYAFSILCHKYVGNVNPWQEQVCKALYDWASKN